MELQLVPMTHPSILQPAQYENDRLGQVLAFSEADSEPNPNMYDHLPVNRRKRLKCTCNARFTRYPHRRNPLKTCYGRVLGQWWFIQSSIDLSQSHAESCPMYPQSQAISTARFRAGVVCGACRSSISQILHFPRIVDEDNPAFKLVNLEFAEWGLRNSKARQELLDLGCEPIPSVCSIKDWHSFLGRRIRQLGRLCL